MAAVDTTGPGITFATSSVRLACAIRKMGDAQTLQALVAIKDAAKSSLLERDLHRLKTAYEARKQYLRAIPTNTATTDQE